MEKFCPGVNLSNMTLERVSSYPILFFSGESNISNFNGSRACNCTEWYEDTTEATAIAIIRIITSVISILGSASIILSVLLSGRLNKAEVHPLFILSVADFILSILWMIGGVVWLNPGEGGWAQEESDPHTGMCYVLGMATTMAGMVTFLLTLVYAQNALLRIIELYKNNGKVLNEKDQRKKVRHVLTVIGYIVSWILPLFILLPTMETLVGIEKTNFGCWCILDFFNLRPDDGLPFGYSNFNQYALIHASVLGSSFLVSTTAIIIFYVLTFIFARKVLKQQEDVMHGENNRVSKMIKSIIIRLTAFITIFFVSGLPIIAASIDVWKEKERLHLNEPSDKFILYTHALLAPLQGFLNAVVYGWSRKEFRKAVNFGRIKSIRGDRRTYESLNTKSRSRDSNSRFNSLNLNRALHT